jgi:hypothetical protein
MAAMTGGKNGRRSDAKLAAMTGAKNGRNDGGKNGRKARGSGN